MSTKIKLALATICLNSEEFLHRLIQQHHDWNGAEVVAWVFVHGADAAYCNANPTLVNNNGLSVDRTGDILRWMEPKIQLIETQPVGDIRSDQNKCLLRNLYLAALDGCGADYLYVLDDDEFVSRSNQTRMIETARTNLNYDSWRFVQRHLWKSPQMDDPPPWYEVVGGYWAVPHCRMYRFMNGLKYLRNHNEPCMKDGYSLHLNMWRGHGPEVIHAGFSKTYYVRHATNHYYQCRGEMHTRKMYVECRQSWANYRLGDTLPHGATVKVFDGELPECLT